MPNSTPTQVKRPTRASIRTAFQGVIGWVVAAGLVLPVVLSIAQEELGDVIPPEAMGYVAMVVGVAVAVSTFTARVMAIPAVEYFLARHGFTRGLAADPNSKNTELKD